MNFVKRFVQDEEGQALAEYGLILGLIAVVVVAAVIALGGQINEAFQAIVDALGGGEGEGEGEATE